MSYVKKKQKKEQKKKKKNDGKQSLKICWPFCPRQIIKGFVEKRYMI